MKKHLLNLVLVLAFGAATNAQTITSVANGNFLNPLTWDCTCVPAPGYDVVINHAVVLNTNWAYGSGSFTINASGSLVEDATARYLGITGGAFSNSGTFGITGLGLTGGTFVNNTGGVITSDSLYFTNYIVNNGLMQIGALHNNGGAIDNFDELVATNFLCVGNFFNDYYCEFYNFYNANYGQNNDQIVFTNFTNAGQFENYAYIAGENDFTNAGIFYNDTNSIIQLAFDFTNVDSVNHDAYFENHGHFFIGGSITNVDTLAGEGTGVYCVMNSSANLGEFQGSFDFCDQSHGGMPPWTGIDYNTGVIDPLVQFCAAGNPCTSSIPENESELVFYPNPASSVLNIESQGMVSVRLIDNLGRVVYSESDVMSTQVNTSGFGRGYYLLEINDNKSLRRYKIVLQ